MYTWERIIPVAGCFLAPSKLCISISLIINKQGYSWWRWHLVRDNEQAVSTATEGPPYGSSIAKFALEGMLCVEGNSNMQIQKLFTTVSLYHVLNLDSLPWCVKLLFTLQLSRWSASLFTQGDKRSSYSCKVTIVPQLPCSMQYSM